MRPCRICGTKTHRSGGVCRQCEASFNSKGIEIVKDNEVYDGLYDRPQTGCTPDQYKKVKWG